MRYVLAFLGGLASAAGLAIWMMRPRPEDLRGWSAHGASEARSGPRPRPRKLPAEAVVYRSPAAEMPRVWGAFPNICGALPGQEGQGYCTLQPDHRGLHAAGPHSDPFETSSRGYIREATEARYHPLHP